jgi:hypothetical protein
MKAIASALVKAQREFGPALKTSTNPHFRSRYADLSACVEAVIDALNNNGIFLMQLTEEHRDWRQGIHHLYPRVWRAAVRWQLCSCQPPRTTPRVLARLCLMPAGTA